MTLHFVIKTKTDSFSHKEPRPDSLRVPVYARIKDGRDIDQTVKTEILVNPTWWDCRLEELSWKSKCPVEELIQTNRALSDLRNHLISAYLNDKRSHKVSREWLKDECLRNSRGTSRRDDIQILIKRYCDEKRISALREISYLSLAKTLKHYEAYRVEHEDPDFTLDLSSIDQHFLNRFKVYLRDEADLYEQDMDFFKRIGFSRHPRHRSENTIIDLLKKFRAFYNWYAQKERLPNAPFAEFKVEREIYGTPICLSKEELTAIRLAPMPTKRLEEARDIFLFQCNVGCRVGDLLRLKKSNVSNDELSYIPSKSSRHSGRRVLVPLNAVARSIILKYEDLEGDDLLPYGTVHQYNSAIKRILRTAGVDRQVTVLDPLTRKERQVPIYVVASSHMARRSFINNLYSKVKDSELVASLTGHVEGSQSFFRYREIGTDIKRDLVTLLE